MQQAISSSAPVAGEIRSVNPLEQSDWDERVRTLPGAGFFHSQAWARVLHETYAHKPFYQSLIVAGRLQGLLPLVEVDSWLTGRRGVALPFTDEIEPLCPDLASFQTLLDASTALAKSRAWKYLEIRGGRNWLPHAPPSTSFFSHSLDLSRGEAALFAGFQDSVRRAIRKSERTGLQVGFFRNAESIQIFYKLVCLTRRRHGLPPQPYSFFEQIQRHVLESGHGWVVLARQGDTPLAGAVFFHFGSTAIYKFGASDEAYQHLRPNQLTLWKAIQHYTHHGFTNLNLGRTSLYNRGLRTFKLGWGTCEKTTEYIRIGPQGDFATNHDSASGWYNTVFRIIPPRFSRLAGRLLYKHIA